MPARNGAAVYTRTSGPGSRRLVRLRPYRLRDARFPTPHAGLGWLRRAELGIGQEAHRRPRLPLDLRLARGRAAEPTVGEPAPTLHELDELTFRDAAHRMGLAPLPRPGEQPRLQLGERLSGELHHGVKP